MLGKTWGVIVPTLIKLFILCVIISIMLCSSTCGDRVDTACPDKQAEDNYNTGLSINADFPTHSPSAVTTHEPEPERTQTPEPTPEGEILYENFNSLELDKNCWTALDREKTYNNELQYYVPGNVIIKDDNLILRAYEQDYMNHNYTSGLVNTEGKLALKFVNIEIRAKHPAGKGLFAAIWLSPEGEEYLPEIDIMEVVGDEPGTVWVVHHFVDNGIKGRSFTDFKLSDINDYHIYLFEWEPDEMRWYIDGEIVHKTNKCVPDVEMYLIINLAVGGNWPGTPGESTVFPADFVIDYVKIYKNEGGLT